jgi:MFS transporter, ACS family, tartrate transporter
VLEKMGARRWIARIMVSWGGSPWRLLSSRRLRGCCKARGFRSSTTYEPSTSCVSSSARRRPGFFPASSFILYLTYWFTGAERARWIGLFMVANPLSTAIGGPVSGLILDTSDGAAGLGGWQWLFIIEGVPAVLVGFWVLIYLTDRPKEAAWLEAGERTALQASLDDERKSREAIRHYTLREALTNYRVLGLSLVYFGLVSGNYGLIYWLPQIVKGVASDIELDKITGIPINALTGYLVVVPFAFAVVAMIWWTRRSDATHERVWHVAGPAIASGLSLIAAALGAADVACRWSSIWRHRGGGRIYGGIAQRIERDRLCRGQKRRNPASWGGLAIRSLAGAGRRADAPSGCSDLCAVERNVSTTLRQPSVKFKLGFLEFSSVN